MLQELKNTNSTYAVFTFMRPIDMSLPVNQILKYQFALSNSEFKILSNLV